MSPKQHAPRAGRSHRPPDQESMMEFFFEGGNTNRPRRELVRRDELWGVLEWQYRRLVRENNWWHRLMRSFRRMPVTRLNPFVWVRLQRTEAADGDA